MIIQVKNYSGVIVYKLKWWKKWKSIMFFYNPHHMNPYRFMEWKFYKSNFYQNLAYFYYRNIWRGKEL